MSVNRARARRRRKKERAKARARHYEWLVAQARTPRLKLKPAWNVVAVEEYIKQGIGGIGSSLSGIVGTIATDARERVAKHVEETLGNLIESKSEVKDVTAPTDVKAGKMVMQVKTWSEFLEIVGEAKGTKDAQ